MWLAWFAGLRGYYRTMLRYIAGRNPVSIEQRINRIAYENQRRGALQAKQVFYDAILRGRGTKVAARPLDHVRDSVGNSGNEALNSSFYTDVRAHLEHVHSRRGPPLQSAGRGDKPARTVGLHGHSARAF